MENRYWIGRKRSAMGMARSAMSAEARLIHYDLAGRYSVKAAQCLSSAAAAGRPAARAERAKLSPPQRQSRPHAYLGLRQDGQGS